MGNEEPSEKLIQQRDKGGGKGNFRTEWSTVQAGEKEATELEWGRYRGSNQTEGRESV